MQRNFLVVAADARHREHFSAGLARLGYSVTRATCGGEAERAVRGIVFDAVVVESNLGDMSAVELRTRLREMRPDLRVLVLSSFERVRGSAEQLRFGASDYLVHADDLLGLIDASRSSEREEDADPAARREREALLEVVDVLVGLLELDDKHFGGSSHKAMRLAREMAEELGADDQMVHEIVIATLLRDIGKAGLDPELLEAKSEFTDEQRERMKDHVAATLRLFEHVDFPWKVLPIIRHHHERYDGNGYPEGLRGREIPLGARIIAVVDAYLALTSGRAHRAPAEPEDALQELIGQTGRHFDPEVIEAFQKVLDKRLLGRKAAAKPRVVLVVRQPDFRRLLKLRLVNEGMDVVDVADAGRAVAELKRRPVDLVLADLEPDAAAAFGLLESIRESAELCRVPFAFLAATEDRILKIRALRQGVDDYLSKAGDLDELVARVENILVREAVRRQSGPLPARRGIAGDLETLAFPEIVQTLAMGMKTACVSLRSDGRDGSIWFENGAVKDAETERQQGDDAFYEMVRWKAGEFVIEHGVRTDQARIEKDAMYMLMEGLRLIDEEQRDETPSTAHL